MTIADLIKLASNKLAMLNNQRGTAEMSGDTSAIEQLDNAISETQATLNKLHTLE